MSIESSEQYFECKQFAKFLEQSSFDEVKKYLKSIMLSDRPKYLRFANYIEDMNLLAEISNHKIALAKYIAKESRVIATADDRTRIVLHLSKIKGTDLDEINKKLQKEFGDYFQVFDSYSINGKKLSLANIRKRASEIMNGIKNLYYLETQATVAEIMTYFKTNSIADKEKLLQIKQATFNLMMKMKDPAFFISARNYKDIIKPELIDYYRLTNRTEIDIKALDDDPDFDAISKFIYMMAQVVPVKLDLISRKFSPNNTTEAERIISNKLAKIEFEDGISTEEWARFGLPLPRRQ